MRSEYDFSKAKRAKDVPHLAKLQTAMKGKTRITIMLDNDVLDSFRARAEAEGRGYQTAINEALRNAINADAAPVTVATLRKELKRALKDKAA
ncbi:MAG: BrnA antitoxin family protein [Xanthomonadaceae bacterium]|nr:BrnA antitoxin family protein [Xanthomonadaceae bacterium]